MPTELVPAAQPELFHICFDFSGTPCENTPEKVLSDLSDLTTVAELPTAAMTGWHPSRVQRHLLDAADQLACTDSIQAALRDQLLAAAENIGLCARRCSCSGKDRVRIRTRFDERLARLGPRVWAVWGPDLATGSESIGPLDLDLLGRHLPGSASVLDWVRVELDWNGAVLTATFSRHTNSPGRVLVVTPLNDDQNKAWQLGHLPMALSPGRRGAPLAGEILALDRDALRWSTRVWDTAAPPPFLFIALVKAVTARGTENISSIDQTSLARLMSGWKLSPAQLLDACADLASRPDQIPPASGS